MLPRWVVVLVLAVGSLGFRNQRQAEFLGGLDWYALTSPSVVSPSGVFVSHSVHKRSSYADFHEESGVAGNAAGESGSQHAQEQWVARGGADANLGDSGTLHISVPLGSQQYHLELELNRRLLSADIAVERRGRLSRPGAAKEGGKSTVGRGSTQATRLQCHYVGRVKGVPASAVAVTTCGGLSGMIMLNNTHYFIEPLELRNHSAGDAETAQQHVLYKVPPSVLKTVTTEQHHIQKRGYSSVHPPCGVSDDDYPRGTGRRRASSRRTSGRRKRSTSMERFVEALVVVDPTMMAYYKDEDVETYVFSIMNMVSAMYHDATIGNAINIVVVRLLLLEVDEPGLVIKNHAENTLTSFCEWQQTINADKSSPEHHDVAILLTRINICSKIDEPCSTLGLANLNGMCQPDRSCSVNEDTGLALAYTVAHELGHNLGMKHDGPSTECPLPSGEKIFIMAPEMMTEAGSLLLWSKCSRDAVTRFLDRGWGNCLNDEPGGRTRPDYPIPPPGVMYDADHQCRLQYGGKAKHCEGIEDVCSTLWCYTNNHCMTRLEPAAEGTLCDADNSTVNGVAIPKKWCFAGKCTAIGERPAAIDGGWAAWSSWSECTRTCGGGVTNAERHCDNPMPSNGGRYCIGERRRYRICNTQPCPEGAPTFREVQCGEHNSKPYEGELHEWEPFSTPDNPCQLVCKPKNMYFTMVLREVVRDGTPCRTGTRNMCLAGICRAVGCDWIIDSEAKEDRCGVCHGDGSTCKTIKDQFKAEEGMGYVEAAIIPEGARNIRVEEVAEANNYLAIRSQRGDYYLNGHWFIQWSGDYSAAGTVIHYERHGNKEGITAVGPLREPLHIMLLFQSHNPGVLFEYTVPHENATRRLAFTWKYLDWSHCTVSCGGGLQRLKVVCSEQEAGIVEDIFCKNATKPDDKARPCNIHLCPARWWTGPWQHCSATCGGITGLRRRTVLCVRSLGPDEQMALDDADCEPLPRPQADEPCQRHSPPCPPAVPVDVGGKWGTAQPRRNSVVPCSDLCERELSGDAQRCRHENGECLHAETGHKHELCLNVTCGEWRVTGWSECPCEGGEQTAVVACVDGSTCSAGSRPPMQSRYCPSRSCKAASASELELSSGRQGNSDVDSVMDTERGTQPDSRLHQVTADTHSLLTSTAISLGTATKEVSDETNTMSTAQPITRARANASDGKGWKAEEEGHRKEESSTASASSKLPVAVPSHSRSAYLSSESDDGGHEAYLEDLRTVIPTQPAHEADQAVSAVWYRSFNNGEVSIGADHFPLLPNAMADQGSIIETKEMLATGTAASTEIQEEQSPARGEGQGAEQREEQDEAQGRARGNASDANSRTDALPGGIGDGIWKAVYADSQSETKDQLDTAAAAVEPITPVSSHSDDDAAEVSGELAAEKEEPAPSPSRHPGGASRDRAHWLGTGGAPGTAAITDVPSYSDLLPDASSTSSSTHRLAPAAAATWETSEWSKCSAVCGNGWQTRSVWCTAQPGDDGGEGGCEGEGQAPDSRRPCATPCTEWVAGPWSQCSVTCGGGEQIRNVQCINRQTDHAAAECNAERRPADTQTCGMEKCAAVSAALQEWSSKECEANKLASSTCNQLKDRGYCLFTYVFKNCCISCSA